jgi:hypothetical protein
MNFDLTSNRSSPDLGELLAFSESTKVENNPERFSINSVELAAWAIRKIADSRARIQSRNELASLYKQKIETWLEKANAEDSESIDLLMGHLKPFAEVEIGNQRRSKTLVLPGGSISLRKKPDRLEILDEAETIEFCEKHLPEAIIIKKSVSKTAIKASLATTGCLPPSVKLILGESELSIAVDETPIIGAKQNAA